MSLIPGALKALRLQRSSVWPNPPGFSPSPLVRRCNATSGGVLSAGSFPSQRFRRASPDLRHDMLVDDMSSLCEQCRFTRELVFP